LHNPLFQRKKIKNGDITQNQAQHLMNLSSRH
jgi:hypothetical protein